MPTLILICAALIAASTAWGAALEFRSATIVVPANATVPEKSAARMLAEEIEKRTQLRLKMSPTLPSDGAVFVLGRANELNILAARLKVPAAPAKPEGFGLSASMNGERAVAIVSGTDDRGVVFGTGYLLRQLHMRRQTVTLDGDVQLTTSPAVAIRGQQLGYRPKTNAYDAWSVPMWEQYIRELAIFGNNTIELIPPRSDDDAESPHFPLAPMDMMVEMSRIANSYDMDVSIWYPAMDPDYADPKTVEFALKEWEEVYRRLPRIDVIFVPGGDPGHTQPKYLMALLEKQTALLHRYHPKAQMWLSPQSFSKDWMREFYSILRTEPKWLSGVVYGPQTMYPLAELRAEIPKRYPIRFYPDITHSIHSQFPAPEWDAAYATTEGREVVNPRPLGEAVIFHKFAPYFAGFVTYSEGCNDDVNKMVWSGLGWNPEVNIKALLTEYGRFFIADEFADSFAEGLLALERNWRGPLLQNTGVDTTLLQFQEMDREARPATHLSWRFQQGIYRASYDALLRARLLAETRQEEQALAVLRQAPRDGSLTAMSAAEHILEPDLTDPATRELRARVFEMAEALFQSIHMQLSVPRYKAIALGRGANLDAIDFALNDRVWLKNQFAEIRKLDTEPARLAALDRIANWSNPGPGGFYDDLGNMAQQPHLVPGPGFEQDPDFAKSAMIGFGAKTPQQGWRVSWYDDAETLFEEPLQMRYANLDPKARYKVRVVYGGDMLKVPIRLVANQQYEIHPYRAKENPPAPVEFEIPPAATQGGTLTLEWSRPPGLGGNGRGAQVAEVWLVKTAAKE